LRYDLAVKDPGYIKELVTHHVGGYLKIAPEQKPVAVAKPNAGKLQGGKILTQHTGLPPKPRAGIGGKPKPASKPKRGC